MTLVFAKLRSSKLSNRELAKHYDRLYNQNKVEFGHTGLTRNTQKAAYIIKFHPFIETRIREEKLESLIDRAKLGASDIKVISGGVKRDLTTLEAKLDKGLTQKIESHRQPAIELNPDRDLKEQLLEFSRISQQGGEPTFNTTIDMSMATEIDPDEFELEPEVETVNAEAQITPDVKPAASQTDPLPIPGNTTGGKPAEMKVFGVTADAEKMKLDTSSSIPVWKTTNNTAEEASYLRQYIRDLTRFKALGLLSDDAVLINASLVKSGRTDIYAEIPKEAENDVGEFIKYLRMAYGLSAVDLLRELQNTRQESNESPYAFLSRVINLFYEARNESKKAISEVMESPTETNEIIRIYLNGLQDARVRIAVRSRLDGLDLSKIARATRNAMMALKEQSLVNAPVNNVNALDKNVRFEDEGENESIDEDCDEDFCEDYYRCMNINAQQAANEPIHEERQAQKSFRAGKIVCFYCGRLGHIARHCFARQHDEMMKNGQEHNDQDEYDEPYEEEEITEYFCNKCGERNLL